MNPLIALGALYLVGMPTAAALVIAVNQVADTPPPSRFQCVVACVAWPLLSLTVLVSLWLRAVRGRIVVSSPKTPAAEAKAP